MRLTTILLAALTQTTFLSQCGDDGSSSSDQPPGYSGGTCQPRDWVSPQPSVPVGGNGFAMIIASDSQLPWYSRDSSCDEDCVREMGELTNTHHVQAMNDILSVGNWPTYVGGGSVAPVHGVIMNGDLTAFWHDWQVDLFRKYYDAGYSDAHEDVLKYPMYPGLGNHDYANNVDDCWGSDPTSWITWGSNSCAHNAVEYMRDTVMCGESEYFPWDKLKRYDDDSLAYSWDIGRWHFVQLHNYPTYDADPIEISSAIPWLKQDLRAATEAGMHIVLNMHDYGDHWSPHDQGFLDALADTNVVAVFAGHYHSHTGKKATVPGTSIPVFRSGAAEYNRMLLVEFRTDEFVVGVIDTANGIPTFYNPTEGSQLGVYSVD